MGGCINAATCDTSDRANPTQRYTEGVTSAGVYQSTTSWHSGYLHYPGGRHYEFVHNLGATPAFITVSLAFDPNPSGLVSPSCSGNTCLVTADDTVIQLKNDTCAEFWVRVVAGLASIPQPDAGAEPPGTPEGSIEVPSADAGDLSADGSG